MPLKGDACGFAHRTTNSYKSTAVEAKLQKENQFTEQVFTGLEEVIFRANILQQAEVEDVNETRLAKIVSSFFMLLRMLDTGENDIQPLTKADWRKKVRLVGIEMTQLHTPLPGWMYSNESVWE